jgi:hypothetical protein
LRNAEFGFFGVTVQTRTHTPRRCGQALSAGLLLFFFTSLRPLRTNWLIVGIEFRLRKYLHAETHRGGNEKDTTDK